MRKIGIVFIIEPAKQMSEGPGDLYDRSRGMLVSLAVSLKGFRSRLMGCLSCVPLVLWTVNIVGCQKSGLSRSV